MTENQAIKILKDEKSWESDDRKIDAFIMGIEALEEIQQYRAIGTVEGYENAIKSYTETYILMKEYKSKLQELEAIGTVAEFKALKDKNKPKKVVAKGQGHEADCYCPNCNTFLGSDQDFCFNQTKHCGKCGQALET